jgi:hypothetical protein
MEHCGFHPQRLGRQAADEPRILRRRHVGADCRRRSARAKRPRMARAAGDKIGIFMHFQSERLLNFHDAYRIYRRELYRDKECSEPFLCNLHNVFGTEKTAAHNCLGCNFADLTNSFDQILKWLPDCYDINTPCVTFIFWLYLFVERYDQIMNFVNVPEGYRNRHFPSFQQIRHWANFVKHPKSFLFSHHPEFLHGGELGDDFDGGKDAITINQQFVDTYYAGKDNNSKLASLLNNATKVIVVYPNPEPLMERFVCETKEFIRLLEKNEVYREELSRITTAPDYYAQESDAQQSKL